MLILCRFDAYSKHNTRETFDEYSVQKKLGIAYPPNNINHWAFAEVSAFISGILVSSRFRVVCECLGATHNVEHDEFMDIVRKTVR